MDNLLQFIKDGDLTEAESVIDVAISEHPDSFLEILDGVDEDDECLWTPLLWACKKGCHSIMKLLLDNGVNPNYVGSSNWNALCISSWYGDEEGVALLLDSGRCDVNGRGSENSYTPLMMAVSNGQMQVCRILLRRGADVNATAENIGSTAVNLACEFQDPSLMKLLLDDENCTIIDKKTTLGWAPINIAASRGHTEVVMELVRQGCYAKAVTKANYSSLRLACEKRNIPLIKFLVQLGLDMDEKDIDNVTVREVCYLKGLQDEPEIQCILSSPPNNNRDVVVNRNISITM